MNIQAFLKNTSFLYLRMVVVLAVSLYTSRVVLLNLGLNEFGLFVYINNIIIIIGFFGTAMFSTSQKFLSEEIHLGNNERISRTFSLIFTLQLVLGILLFIGLELVFILFMHFGILFNVANSIAPFYLINILILNFIFGLILVPFTSLILSAEKNIFFALLSILESGLKLSVAYLIGFFEGEKLLAYCILTLTVSFLIFLVHYFYCSSTFNYLQIKIIWDKRFFKKITGMFSWNVISDFAYSLYGPGLTFLLGTFHGAFINASTAVAFQIIGAINNIVKTFQTALNPQVIKARTHDFHLFKNLLYAGSKMSFYLIFIICIPFLLETNWLLKHWLVVVPDYAALFLRPLLIIIIIESFIGPFTSGAVAYGKLSKFQGLASILIFLIFPSSALFLKLGYPPQIIFYVGAVFSLLAMFLKGYILSGFMKIKFIDFYVNIFQKSIFVILFTAIVLFSIKYLGSDYLNPLLRCIVYIAVSLFAIWLLGISDKEKEHIKIFSRFKTL